MKKQKHEYVYFIEHKEKTGWWLTGKDYGYVLTQNPEKAVCFDGKDAKEHAKLYLGLHQAAGKLKDFIVTEHEFVKLKKKQKPMGWICPNCGKGLSPFVIECDCKLQQNFKNTISTNGTSK